jgi:phenylpropionate dioxygenase-like ring-hydroxylating dioxygenase large terminal subunit
VTDTLVTPSVRGPGLADTLAAIAAAGALDLADSTTIPPTAYNSPELFELEKSKLLRAGWIMIGRADQVAEPGNYLSVDVLDTPLVMTRDRDGVLHVLSRVCAHRWMEVVSGQGTAAALQCPYHLWTYSLAGTLSGAPHMREAEGFERTECRLPEVAHEEWLGFVFVNLDGEAEPLTPKLLPLAQTLQAYGVGDLVTVETVDWGECEWDWKIMVENYMECYHHIGSHRQTLQDKKPGELSWTDTSNEHYSILHSVARPPKPDEKDPGITALLIHIYPSMIFGVRPDGVGILRVMPLGAGRMHLYTDRLMTRAAVEAPDYEEKLAKGRELSRSINLEDFDVCRAVQASTRSPLAGSGRLSHLEEPLWRFYRYLARELTA